VTDKPPGRLLTTPAAVILAPMSEVMRILSALERGDPHAADQLLPLVYDELRKLAAQKLAQEKPGQTLEATALVNEAYLRLVDVEEAQHWNSRGHFFAAAAEAIRRILIENARRKRAEKHGGGLRRVNLDQADALAAAPPEDLLAFDEALERLARHDPKTAQLVRLHCFAGLPVEQAAEALDLSRTSAYRLWTFARAWLHSQLSDGREAES
jgi:RNA polymerase sigma factor (TIGR02999 family)